MERFGLGARWAYWDAINDVYHGLSREGVAELSQRRRRAVQSLRRDPAARRAHGLPGAASWSTPIRSMSRSNMPRPIRRRAPISTPTRISSPMARMSAVRAGSCRCAASPGSRRGRRWCSNSGRRAAGRGQRFSTIATWENKGKNIDFEGERYVWSKHVNFLRIPRPAEAQRAGLHHGAHDCRAARGRGADRGQGLAASIDPRPSLAAASRPTAISSAPRAASSPSPRTSMCGRRAAGSATAACAISPPAGRW